MFDQLAASNLGGQWEGAKDLKRSLAIQVDADAKDLCRSLAYDAKDLCRSLAYDAKDLCKSLAHDVKDLCRSLAYDTKDLCRSLAYDAKDLCRSLAYAAKDLCRSLADAEVMLWRHADNPPKLEMLEMNSKVIGTARGNLMIYNKRTLKKQTIMGKHSKKVNCGASAFRYGTIKQYAWFGDGYLVVGFSQGYIAVGLATIVIISSQMKEISEELSSVKYHRTSLDSLCCSKDALPHKCSFSWQFVFGAAGKIASAGDDGIKIISMKDWTEIKSEKIQIRPEAKVTHMHWSDDGELLSFCTEAGWVYCYLAKLTALSATCNTRLAYLTSLREMTVIEGANENGNKVVLQTDVEPAFVALGPAHLATGMNNRIWFYSCSDQGSAQCVNEQEYIGSVESVSLNSTHACVLIEGRVYLHPIERNSGDGKTIIFPRKEDDRTITCTSIVGNFLIYAHSNGRLQYYSLVDGTAKHATPHVNHLPLQVNEYKHQTGIRKCFPNHEGTRVCL
ncbi:unnamed protein product [Polarella glacialis]|uniref:Uncharacterized protein n=1 Tax=Polarella glacialis TaxID=89957 RepID=A0A813I109_POLGL|nr:unnamed protein product [Polarella glacialis]